jgi:hypothetical protein
MPRLDEFLNDAVGDIRPTFDYEDLERGARRRRSRRRSAIVVAGVCSLLVALGAVALSLQGTNTATRITTTDSARTGPFRSPTDTALILDDGYDGVTVVDVDGRVAVRRPIGGQRGGDQPYRLRLVNGALIVGWSDVYAAPLNGGPSRRFPNSTIAIPAAEANTVWLVDYPGGSIGLGVPTFRRVDIAGNVLQEARGFDPLAGYPAIGIPGGIAFETSTGLALWNATSGKITGHLGTQGVSGAEVHGSLLAWCDGLCRQLHITDIGRSDVTVPAPAGRAFAITTARFSPNGDALAIFAANPPPPVDTRPVVAVIDAGTGRLRTFAPAFSAPSGLGFVAWSPTGNGVWASSSSTSSDSQTHLAFYQLANDTIERATLPFGGAGSLVAIARDNAKQLLTGPLFTADDCAPPRIQPSGRTNACRFRFRLGPTK